MLARNRLGAVQLACERLVQYLVDQRAFAGAGNARDADELAEWNFYIDILEVVLGGSSYLEELAVALTPLLGYRHGALAAKVLSRDGVPARLYLIHVAGADDLAAVYTRAGADVDNAVGGVHGLLVVLDYDHRVAEVAKALEGAEELFVVALVKSDARLVEDIQNAHQRAAYLGREADTLAFAAAESARAARKGQVAQTDALEEVKALGDLLDDFSADDTLLLAQLERLNKVDRVDNALFTEICYIDSADCDGKALAAQAVALAVVAGDLRHICADLVLNPVGRGLAVFITPSNGCS